jgi:hypothetical protein
MCFGYRSHLLRKRMDLGNFARVRAVAMGTR